MFLLYMIIVDYIWFLLVIIRPFPAIEYGKQQRMMVFTLVMNVQNQLKHIYKKMVPERSTKDNDQWSSDTVSRGHDCSMFTG